MDIKKRCQWCGEPFIAHKMTTLYCSKLCIDRAYKAKEKEKIKEEKLNELSSTFPIVESIGQKPFMTPREAAKLLGIGKTTMYRYMAQGIIKVFRTPARTIVRRSLSIITRIVFSLLQNLEVCYLFRIFAPKYINNE